MPMPPELIWPVAAAQPAIGGSAPGMAPNEVLSQVSRLSGV